MRKILFLLVLLFVCQLPLSAAKNYAPEGTPTRAIQDLDDLLDSYILNPKNQEQKEFNAQLKKKILQGTFDVKKLCQSALGKHWKRLSRRERNHFVALMTSLLEKKAIFSKEQGGKKTGSTSGLYFVTYEGDRHLNEEKSLALVRTYVQIPSENLKIGLNYKVTKNGSGWNIYDVVVDDASLVDNYKYQFDKIISQHGYEDLVRRMESKLRELTEKETGVSETADEEMVPEPTPEKPTFGCSCRKGR